MLEMHFLVCRSNGLKITKKVLCHVEITDTHDNPSQISSRLKLKYVVQQKERNTVTALSEQKKKNSRKSESVTNFTTVKLVTD